MFSFPLNEAPPHGARALFVKEKAYLELLNGLQHLCDISQDFLNDLLSAKFKRIQKNLKAHNTHLFPYTLLNARLIQAVEKEDVTLFSQTISDFKFDLELPNLTPFILPFDSFHLSKSQWEQVRLTIIFDYPKRTTLAQPTESKLARTQETVVEAYAEIKAVSPEYYEDLQVLISAILVVNSNTLLSGSSFDILGMMYLGDHINFNMTVEYIVHELAHEYLFNLSVFDEICSGTELLISPLRKKPRSVEGVYHATFVLARLIDFYTKALDKYILLSPDFITTKLKYYKPLYKDAYDLLMEKATLTDLGRELLKSTRALAL